MNHVLPSDDMQLVESLTVCAYGVVSLLEISQSHNIKIIAEWYIENVFHEDLISKYRNISIRQAGRLIVEYAYQLSLISADSLKKAKPPYALKFKLLEINKEAAAVKNGEIYGPIFHDHAWYNIKEAYDGFFEYENESLYKDASKILKEYSKILGFKVNDYQLTLSLVYQMILGLGWNHDTNDATHSIYQNHFMLHGGGRATVMGFAEKYLWIAVYHLQGYFSDYIAYSGLNERKILTDYHLLVSIFNPIQPALSVCDNKKFVLPCSLSGGELLVDGELTSGIMSWVKESKLPDFKEWIFPGLSFTQRILDDNNELCLLRSSTFQREPKGLGESLLWINSFLIDKSDMSFFEKILQGENGLLRRLILNPESNTTIRYDNISPRDIIFQNWRDEEYDSILLPSAQLNNRSSNEIKMQKCVREAQIAFENSSKTAYLPSKIIQQGVGIIQADGYKFKDKNGKILSISIDVGEPFKDSQNNLYINKEAFFLFLENEKKFPVWLIRFDRKPSRESSQLFEAGVNTSVSNYQVIYLKDDQLQIFHLKYDSCPST